ncbi:ATP-binding cassette domain-containing protein [Gordonia sp. HNM0687]|uniref:ATP-binding cassette domain-containing protein n=2 Tax=Gordonia mangrovi TaxID=2665643 RepID=A0A6L7GUZ9_9ACTN|nr:sugar ABC transporter ATP-binding protein [Gordonia mangrovi]MXP23864.1 ATP-binding cassette domain-containing protein [Gordonia mangrovi]
MVMTELALSARGLRKTFDSIPALCDVDIDIAAGSIHALLGGNGSGKSTLIKILAGVHTADAGALTVQGMEIDARRVNPSWAARVGLRFVHQDLGLFDELSVAENLTAAQEFPIRHGRIDWRALRNRAAKLIERFDIGVTPEQPLVELSQVERTLVAIARALQDDELDGATKSVLVLDEPTSCLPNDEASRLLGRLSRYAAAGHTILMVSHRLGDVVGVAHSATVLRDGRKAATLTADEITEDRIVELIAGGAVPQRERRNSATMLSTRTHAPLLDVESLPVASTGAVTFSCWPGETVGIAGMVGSGRSRLLRSIFGAQVHAGSVRIEDQYLEAGSIGSAIAAGVAYVPENRAADAAFMDQSIQTNMSIVGIRDYWRGFRLRLSLESADARRDSERFLVASNGCAQPLSALSGGNQQKVILARWLRNAPRVALLDEPSQGVDVGARAEIHQLIASAVADGATALVVSSDFAELAELCDRVLVLRAGSIVAEVPRDELSEHRLTSLAASSVAVASHA